MSPRSWMSSIWESSVQAIAPVISPRSSSVGGAQRLKNVGGVAQCLRDREGTLRTQQLA